MLWEAGDLLFFTGTDWTARVIRAATAYPLRIIGPVFGPSHVGIIVPDGDQSLLVESTTLTNRPCLLNGRCISGAQAHVPEERIADYLRAGGSVAVYRLTHRCHIFETNCESYRPQDAERSWRAT